MSKPFVTYLPKTEVAKLTKPVNLISIRERYEWPEFPVDHNRLDLAFSYTNDRATEHSFNLEQADAVIAFVTKHQDEDIYVHCGEGRMRSPAIAQAIARFSTTHSLDQTVKGCRGSTANSERHAYILLRTRANETYNKEAV